MHTKLSHLPILPPPVTAKQRVVIIPADQPEEGIDSYGAKEDIVDQAYIVVFSYHISINEIRSLGVS